MTARPSLRWMCLASVLVAAVACGDDSGSSGGSGGAAGGAAGGPSGGAGLSGACTDSTILAAAPADGWGLWSSPSGLVVFSAESASNGFAPQPPGGSDRGSVHLVPTDGGASSVLYASPDESFVTGLWVDGNDLFVSTGLDEIPSEPEQGALLKVDIATRAVTTLAAKGFDNHEVRFFGADATHVYFFRNGKVAAGGGLGDDVVFRVPRAGGSPERVWSQETTDDTSVLFANLFDGQIVLRAIGKFGESKLQNRYFVTPVTNADAPSSPLDGSQMSDGGKLTTPPLLVPDGIVIAGIDLAQYGRDLHDRQSLISQAFLDNLGLNGPSFLGAYLDPKAPGAVWATLSGDTKMPILRVDRATRAITFPVTCRQYVTDVVIDGAVVYGREGSSRYGGGTTRYFRAAVSP